MKQLSFFIKIVLFLTSYIPFYLMYWTIDFEILDNKIPFIHFRTILSWIFVILSLSIFILIYILKYFHKTPDRSDVKIISINKIDKEITSYLVTYILPLLTFYQGKTVILLVILIFLIGILYIKTDMLAINPVLMLLGYSIIEAEFKHDSWGTTKHGVFLYKGNFQKIKNLLNNNTKFIITQMNNDFYLILGGVKDE